MLFINNQQDKVNLPSGAEQLLQLVAGNLLRDRGRPEETEVTLVLADDDFIRTLNATYREVDAPTDVLSFSMEENVEGAPTNPVQDMALGDVIISVERAVEQAVAYGHSLERETAYLLVHGILHLLGFNHEDEEDRQQMRRLEEESLAKVGLVR